MDRQDPPPRRHRCDRHRRADDGHRPRGLGVRRRAGHLAGRLQRGVPAAALHPDEVPVAGPVLPRVFGIYPVLYTAYASTTNYGTGHVLSKSQAIDQIQSQSVRPVEGATRYDITPLKDADGVFAGFALFDPEAEQLFLGTGHRADRARPRRRPADHAGDDRSHVRRVGRRPDRCPRRRRAHAARLSRPGHLPDAGGERGRGDHDLGRSGRREPDHAHLRRRRRHDHRCRPGPAGRVPRRRRLLRRRR